MGLTEALPEDGREAWRWRRRACGGGGGAGGGAVGADAGD